MINVNEINSAAHNLFSSKSKLLLAPCCQKMKSARQICQLLLSQSKITQNTASDWIYDTKRQFHYVFTSVEWKLQCFNVVTFSFSILHCLLKKCYHQFCGFSCFQISFNDGIFSLSWNGAVFFPNLKGYSLYFLPASHILLYYYNTLYLLFLCKIGICKVTNSDKCIGVKSTLVQYFCCNTVGG